MSRVLKQFAKNMLWPVGISVGYIAVSFLSGYVGELLGFPFWEAFIAGPFTIALFYFLGFLIWIEWDRAREKVKQENEAIVRAIKDE
jgi:hypothetical protein